jgi:hypothetical protein
MTRNIFIFLGTFMAGALIALVARAAMFNPHAGHDGHPPAAGEYKPMVSNSLVPAPSTKASGAAKSVASPASVPVASRSADSHGNHGAAATTPAVPKPVNTICAICGMPVDPAIPTVEYQGKTIGFGCKMCPPKFKADPELFGPLYLKNEPIKR